MLGDKKVNHDYVHKLPSNLDIIGISKHWLHNYDLHLLQSNHNKFNVYSVSPSPEEDSVYCTPGTYAEVVVLQFSGANPLATTSKSFLMSAVMAGLWQYRFLPLIGH